MKKIMFLSMMMVLALVAGTVYANESGSLPYNGITVFTNGPVAFDDIPVMAGTMNWSYEEGSAAGGWREEEAMTETHPYNGITIFSDRSVDFDAVPLGAVALIGSYEEGTAAGGLHEEEAVTSPENGVTIFSKEPVAFDSLPAGRW